MGNLTDTPSVSEQLIDVKGIDVIKFRITTKDVEVPNFVEVEIPKPVFKVVEIPKPVFKEVDIEVPKIRYDEVDLTSSIKTFLRSEIEAAIRDIVSKVKFDLVVVPGNKGISLTMGVKDGE